MNSAVLVEKRRMLRTNDATKGEGEGKRRSKNSI
jgi:hypothetical protein